jgi:glycosyltransferase involved in cell wall biosynthesis
MAMRVPVVATPAAFEGISAVAGRDLLVAAGPKAFSRAVVTLLRDPAARERYAAAGRTCVETNHNWSRLLRRLEDLVAGGDLPAAAARPSSY